MSTRDSLLNRFLSVPSDFTYRELVTLMKGLGFQEKTKSGSHTSFVDENNHIIGAYRPHPGNILPRYLIRKIIAQLKIYGVIDNE